MSASTQQAARRQRVIDKARRYVVLVCGGRDWRDPRAVRERIERYPAGTLFLHGDCPTGADRFCDIICQELHLPCWPISFFYEDGRSGGPARNQTMLAVLLALRDRYIPVVEAFDTGGRGTADMMRKATKADVKVVVTRVEKADA